MEGYTCMQSIGGDGDFSVHWAVPEATTVKLAAQAQTDGWVALGGSPTGAMIGAQVVQGSSDGIRSVQLNSYSPSTFVDVSIPGVAANDLAYMGADGTAQIEYIRILDEGTDLSVPMAMIGAYFSGPDMDAYHSKRFMFTVLGRPPCPPLPPCIDLPRLHLPLILPPSLISPVSTISSSPFFRLSMPQIDLSAEPSESLVVEEVVDDAEEGADDAVEEEGAAEEEDGKCRPSRLPGFECSLDISGALLHWSNLPSTSAGAPASVNVAIHALQESSGWLSAGFPASPGSGMIGAHVLQGAPSTGLRRVELGAYSASAFVEAPSRSLLGTSVTDEAVNVTNGATTLYFTINGDSGVDIRAPVPMIVAWNTRTDDLSSSHAASDRRAFEINFLSGEESAETSPKQKFWLLHGALMFLGWGLLVPAGVTAASSFKHEDPAWIKAHRALNASGLLAALAGFIVALVELRPFFGEPVVSSHGIIGCVVMLLGCVQPVMAYFRPGKTDPNRVYFNYAHWSFGFSAVILGLANCATGTYLLGQLNSALSWTMIAFLAYLVLGLVTYAALKFLSVSRWSKGTGAKDTAAQAEAGGANDPTQKIQVSGNK